MHDPFGCTPARVDVVWQLWVWLLYGNGHYNVVFISDTLLLEKPFPQITVITVIVNSRDVCSCDVSSCDVSSCDASSCDASSCDVSSCNMSSCDVSSLITGCRHDLLTSFLISHRQIVITRLRVI